MPWSYIGSFFFLALIAAATYCYTALMVDKQSLSSWAASMSDEVWWKKHRRRESSNYGYCAFLAVSVIGVIAACFSSYAFPTALFIGLMAGWVAFICVSFTTLIAGKNGFIPLGSAVVVNGIGSLLSGGNPLLAAFGALFVAALVICAICFCGTLWNEHRESSEFAYPEEEEDEIDSTTGVRTINAKAGTVGIWQRIERFRLIDFLRPKPSSTQATQLDAVTQPGTNVVVLNHFRKQPPTNRGPGSLGA